MATSEATESRWPAASAYARYDVDGLEVWTSTSEHREERRYEG